MKQWFQKFIVERWWVWAFLIFIIFIFRLGEKDDNKEKNTHGLTEKTTVSVEEKEKIAMSEYKQIRTEEELNETLKNIPNTTTTVKQTEAEKENEKVKNEEKRTEQTKQLQQKRDLKNGLILSETLTLEEFKTAISNYIVTGNGEKKTKETSKEQNEPIIHETTSNIYYEQAIKKELIVQANAMAGSQLMKNITAQVKNLNDAKIAFDIAMITVSPELKNEEKDDLIEKLSSGHVFRVQTKKGIVYQWSVVGESGVLTVMKQKE